MPSTLIIVSGPTASGKTDLAHKLADPEQDTIINCDSRQFFRHLQVGVAKPSIFELNRFHYRLINFLEPGEIFTVYEFLNTCIREVESIHKNSPSGKIFLVGGSLFFAKVLKYGLPVFPQVSEEIRNHIEKLWKEKGLSYMVDLLKKKDPEHHREVDTKNPRRVLRALEILESGGQVSDLRKKRKPPPWNFIEIVPIYPRKILYQRIEKRIDTMLSQGWIEEVKRLLSKFSTAALKSCHAIGYGEIIDYLKGKTGYEETITLIKQKTRQMAKRQITWIKKDLAGYLIFNLNSEYNIEEFFLKEKKEFIDSMDRWMNQYPRVSLPLHHSSYFSLLPSLNRNKNQNILPALLLSEDPVIDLRKLIESCHG